MLGKAIGQALPFGVAIALSPIAIIAVALILTMPKGNAKATAFLVGWITGLAGVGAIVLLIASNGNASRHGNPATWVSVLKIVLGLSLLLIAVKQWRGRSAAREHPQLPAWMDTLDRFTVIKSFGIGLLLAAVNNLVLIVGGAVAISQTGAGTPDQAIALAVFVAVGTTGVGTPVAIFHTLADRAGKVLQHMREWMARENATITAVLCLVIGTKLIGDAITALSS